MKNLIIIMQSFNSHGEARKNDVDLLKGNVFNINKAQAILRK